MRILIFFFCLTCFAQTATAQIPPANEAQALRELESRGISEQEFKAAMLKKGYDMDNIRPDQLPGLDRVIEETLRELEAEKAEAEPDSKIPAQDPSAEGTNTTGQPKQNANNQQSQKPRQEQSGNLNDEEIIEAVEEGASVDEAVTEELNKRSNEDIPPAEVYGQNIFRNQTLEVYRSTDNIKPPDSYVLGSGDELVVAVFGRSQGEFAFTINDEGFIKPTGISRIYLRGLTLGKAKDLVRQRFSQYYSFAPEQFSLTVNTARTITVNIFGETEKYGSFTFSAINTAFNALVAAGGPTDIGTVRKIKVISGGETKILDVYDFLFNPNVQYDYFLQNNDVIQVPVSEKVVTLTGAVKRPYKYELIEGEDIIDLFRYAGGLNVNAYLKNVQVSRIVNGQRVIIDVNLEEIIAQNTGFDLENGDEILVRAVSGRLENFTEIEGAVEYPGKYEMSQGMTATNLLNRGTLREDTRRDLAFLLRKNPDESVRVIKFSVDSLLAGTAADIPLQRRDKIILYSQSEYTDEYPVYIRGAVRQPQRVPYEIDMTVADLINQSGGLTDDATNAGYILRTNTDNSELLDYIRFDSRAAVDNPGSAANVTLQPRDSILIFSATDFTDEYQVRVEGSVREPGVYQYSPTLSLKDILTLAGGLQLRAASNRIDIFRLVLNENKPTETVVATLEVDESLNIISGGEINLEPFDIVVVRSVPDFSLQKTVSLQGEVMYPGVYALISKNEKLADLIARAGGLSPEAFPEGATLYRENEDIGIVLLELDKALNQPTSRFNYILKNGDVIILPKSKDLVTVDLSATLANELYPERYLEEGKISVAFVSGKNAAWYLNEYAGGIARNKKARKRFISVEYPNGEFKRSRGFLFFRGTPDVRKGSVVRVGVKPPKPPKPEKEEQGEPIDWTKIITDSFAIISGALTIVVSVIAINRSNE